MIGRVKEQQILSDCIKSNRPEFVAVYGRRRVGKTYLIKKYFNDRFSFYATGISDVGMKEQLRAFADGLKEGVNYGVQIPNDWFEAFSALRKKLEEPGVYRDPVSKKRIVFLDELPWMDTARSNFRSALDLFWNSWASSQDDLVLIVCGSATSWIITNILGDKGGFYNRITKQIHLMPFDLKECEALFAENGITMSRGQQVESYMVFGGIPYYLNLFDRRLSLAQNIEELCFSENGQLINEYRMLFKSLFKNADSHIKIIEGIAKKKSGVTRKELLEGNKKENGGQLTNALSELEQCGFIRHYSMKIGQKQGLYYQVIDPFVLFAIDYLNEDKLTGWLNHINTPSYYSWCGHAFEIVCLNHIGQIKAALGISGVETVEYPWQSRTASPGAQIDLVIDRRDNVIDLCEMKYTADGFVIDSTYAKQLQNKMSCYMTETKTKKSIHMTMVTSNGVKHNEYSGIVQNEIDSEDLFT